MSIEFETDDQSRQLNSRQNLGQSRTSGMASWLARRGLIKNESDAGRILVGIVILNFLLAGAILYFFVF